MISALQEQNVQVAAGQIGQPPIADGQAFQISVRAVGRLTEPGGVRQHYFEDRGRWDAGAVEGRRPRGTGRGKLRCSLLRFNGHDAVGIGVTQLPGANALDVDKRRKPSW